MIICSDDKQHPERLSQSMSLSKQCAWINKPKVKTDSVKCKTSPIGSQVNIIEVFERPRMFVEKYLAEPNLRKTNDTR